MTTTIQVNVRLEEQFLSKAKKYAEKKGYGNVQELIKETLREKLYEKPSINKEELILISKLLKATNAKELWGSEEEALKALER